MSRPTDMERGARIALGIAQMRCTQPDLFDDQPDVDFWREIAHCAQLEIAAAEYLRAALAAAA